MKQNHFAEACPKLEASQRREPRSGTLLNLASCWEHEGKTATAWAQYKEAMVLAHTENRPQNADKASKLAQNLEPKLSRLRVDVEGRVPSEIVTVDGRALEEGAFGVALPIDPGAHTVAASASGYSSWSASITLGKEADTHAIAVPPLEKAAETSSPAAPPIAAPPPNTPPRPETKPGDTSEARSGGVPTWAWVAGGAGIALLAGSVAFHFDQAAAGSSLDKNCGGADRTACAAGYDYDGPRSRELRDFKLFVGLGAAGVVALGVAVIGIVTAPPKRKAPTSSRISPAGWLGPSGFAAGVQGRL